MLIVNPDVEKIHRRVEAMQSAMSGRDRDMSLVRAVRSGRMHDILPQHFSDEMPRAMVANTIDNAARDTAELIAPLPALACASGNMTTLADERRAGQKNKIGSHYWDKSRLRRINIDFSDAVLSYGFGVLIVEPNFEYQCPYIRWESSFGSYYYKDRWGNLQWYAKITDVDMLTLATRYPEKADLIRRSQHAQPDTHRLRLVTYADVNETVVYLPDCGYVVLGRVSNPLKRVPVVVAERPDQEDRPRGQYDDSVYPQVGRAIMTQMALNAADQAINAPIAFPDDVGDVPLGPNAVIRSQHPELVRRVQLDLPNDIFSVQGLLDQATKEGSRYPETRTGGVTGSIITGRGVEALSGTLVTQVSTMQSVIGLALEEATSLCFELDVALWPNMSKRITGVLAGKPFELSYVPSKAIGDSYSCKVNYGFAAGQTPAQAIVALLQLRADNQVSRATSMRQLPFDLDVEEEMRQIDVEELSDAAKQGMAGLSQAFGPMVMQGMDPVPVLKAMARTIELRKRGMPMAEALIAAFTPPKVEEEPELAAPPGPPGMPPELPPGVRDNGLMEGVPYGQAGQPPGGMPAVSSLLASLRGQGSPRMEASVIRKRAIGSG